MGVSVQPIRGQRQGNVFQTGVNPILSDDAATAAVMSLHVQMIG
ncbi:MAG: hypothetical protein WCQ23_00010 [Candidatus Methanomethylophilaceae archaeon]